MPKTIWIVNEYNGPYNVRTRQSILCQRLIEAGYDCYIISGSAENKTGQNHVAKTKKIVYLETDKAKHYVVRTSTYKNNIERVLVSLQFQKRVWKYRKMLPHPDVIVSDFAGLFGNVFLKWKKKYKTKIIFDILDLWPQGFVDMGYLKERSIITKYLFNLEHKSYREADGILFSFQGGRNYIIEKGWSKETGGDVDVSDIGYLNNGVDLETVYQNKNEFPYEDKDLKTRKFKVVYLGSISAFNGLDVLVESARVLQEKGNDNIVILVYGHGNQEMVLRSMVKKYGLNNIFFKGKIDKKYALSLLTKSDLNIFTFKQTNLLKYGVSPNKLFMYFASGKPVLSMIKPAYDLVESRECGISVDNNPNIVADTILRFANMDRKEYVKYCNNATQVAIEYDYKNLVKELIRFIEK